MIEMKTAAYGKDGKEKNCSESGTVSTEVLVSV